MFNMMRSICLNGLNSVHRAKFCSMPPASGVSVREIFYKREILSGF